MEPAFLATLLLIVPVAWAYSNGAPASACSSGPSHGSAGSSEASGDGGFTLGITGNTVSSVVYEHTSSEAVTLTLGGGTFKGFLVRALDESNDYVGSFATSSGVKRIAACGTTATVTHTGASAKTSTAFTWTAPASAGNVYFEVSVVTAYGSNYYKLFAPHAAGDASARGSPTAAPSFAPSFAPTNPPPPSFAPTATPTHAPTEAPTESPTATTNAPTVPPPTEQQDASDSTTMPVFVVCSLLAVMFAWYVREFCQGGENRGGGADEHSSREQSRRDKRKNSATIALEAATTARPRGFGGWD